MKTKIGSYEARTRLSELLRQVRAGRHFIITRRGEPVAHLVPVTESKPRDTAAAITKLKALMLDTPVRGVSVKKLVDAGRA